VPRRRGTLTLEETQFITETVKELTKMIDSRKSDTRLEIRHFVIARNHLLAELAEMLSEDHKEGHHDNPA